MKQPKCGFCGAKMPEVPAGWVVGWVAGHYRDQRWIDRPTCAECAARHLRIADDGEFQMIGHGMMDPH